MVNPDIWGPHAWIFLHAVAQEYPESPTDAEQEQYEKFFSSLRYTLPCPVCREHLTTHLQDHPPQLQSREALERWVVDIHNAVNVQFGQDELSYTDAASAMCTISPTIKSSLNRLCILLVICFIQHIFLNSQKL